MFGLGRLKLALKVFFNPRLLDIQGNSAPQIRILDQLGQARSIREKKPVDVDGNPIPWFTYPSIEYLNQLDLTDYDILEWGSGNSTIYFAKRAKSILTIEHNKEWYEDIKASFGSNVTYIFAQDQEYIEYPKRVNKKFDLIIVDGINRFECLKEGIYLIKEKGLIIYDNSDRHPEHCRFLRDRGFIQIDFHGFGPIVKFTTTTSLFLSKNTKLIPSGEQPVVPTGGGY